MNHHTGMIHPAGHHDMNNVLPPPSGLPPPNIQYLFHTIIIPSSRLINKSWPLGLPAACLPTNLIGASVHSVSGKSALNNNFKPTIS